MKFVLKILFAAAVAVFATSCRESEAKIAKNIITAIQEAANDLNRSGGAGCEIKLWAPSPYTVIYFYPYTSFDNTELDDSAKRELKEISFSVEKPLFAVVDGGRVSGYCDVKLSLEPAGKMPMVWSSHDGVIRIDFRKKPDGSYVLCGSGIQKGMVAFPPPAETGWRAKTVKTR